VGINKNPGPAKDWLVVQCGTVARVKTVMTFKLAGMKTPLRRLQSPLALHKNLSKEQSKQILGYLLFNSLASVIEPSNSCGFKSQSQYSSAGFTIVNPKQGPRPRLAWFLSEMILFWWGHFRVAIYSIDP
jgi:hypothetical protein